MQTEVTGNMVRADGGALNTAWQETVDRTNDQPAVSNMVAREGPRAAQNLDWEGLNGLSGKVNGVGQGLQKAGSMAVSLATMQMPVDQVMDITGATQEATGQRMDQERDQRAEAAPKGPSTH